MNTLGCWLQIAYEYAKRGANLVLVARRDQRLRGISENARRLGAPNVLRMAADVVKEEDCRRFINETISTFGRGNVVHFIEHETAYICVYYDSTINKN
ncbi:putative 11-beta-hydroxysteroid dehydrogenase [Helianthus annuus]|nr:putative 11-beta-hydroxysteroid dehydrogenase [Helianthus annuus]